MRRSSVVRVAATIGHALAALLVMSVLGVGVFDASAQAAAPHLYWGPRVSLNAPEPPGEGGQQISCTEGSICAATALWGFYRNLPYLASTGEPSAATTRWKGPTNLEASAVGCAPAGFCVAGGQYQEEGGPSRAAMFLSTNPGSLEATWSPEPVGASEAYPDIIAVSCPSSTLCVAAGMFGDTFASSEPSKPSARWRSSEIATFTLPEEALTGLSCTAAEVCVAVARDGKAYTSSSPASATPDWVPVTLDAGHELKGVSCSLQGLCMAFDESGHLFVNTELGSAGWRAEEPGGVISGASCASSAFCAIISEGKVKLSSDPAAGAPEWVASPIASDEPASGEPEPIHAISCPTMQLCVAISQFSSYAGTSTEVGAPAVSTGSAQTISESEEIVGGSVNPDGDQIETCEFEYGTSTSYTQRVPCASTPGAVTSTVLVTATLKELTPGKLYHYRLIATNSYGYVAGADRTFTAGSFEEPKSGGGSGGGSGKGTGSGSGSGGGGGGGCTGSVPVSATIVALGCFTANGASFTTKTAVALNGIDLSPGPGGSVSIEPSRHEVILSGTGAVHVGAVPLQAWGGTETWSFAKAQTLTIKPGATLQGKVFGFPIVSPIEVQFASGQAATLSTEVSAKILGASVNGAIGLNTSNSGGLQLNNIRIDVGAEGKVDSKYKPGEFCKAEAKPPQGFVCDAYTSEKGNLTYHLKYAKPGLVRLGGKIPVEELSLEYQHEHDQWSGSATLGLGGLLPGAKAGSRSMPQLKLGAAIEINPFQFDYASMEASGLELPIGPVELRKVGFTLRLHPSFELKGKVDLGAGPPDPKDLEKRMIEIEGEADLKIPGNGFSLALGGKISLIGKVELAKASLLYEDVDGASKVSFNGRAHISLGGISGEVQASGRAEAHYFEAGGSAKVTVYGQEVEGKALVSSVGLGACATIHIKVLFAKFEGTAGFEHFWSGKNEFKGCEFSGLKHAAGGAGASALASGRGIRLPAGRKAAEIVAVGAGAPPRVQLIGPGGVKVSTPSQMNHMTFTGHVLAVAVSDADRTYFVIEHPAAGLWRIVAQKGAPAPTELLQAAPLRTSGIHASVTGSGRRRTLRWRSPAQPGVSLRLTEEGRGMSREITTTRAHAGRLRFTPEQGAGGTRRLYGVITVEGLPYKRLLLARFHVKPRARLTAHDVRYRLIPSGVMVTWHAARHSSAIVIVSEGRYGAIQREVSAGATGVSIRLPASRKPHGVSVSVLSGGLSGPAVKARRESSRRCGTASGRPDRVRRTHSRSSRAGTRRRCAAA